MFRTFIAAGWETLESSYAVLQAAARLPSVKAVATIGAPADPEHVLHHVSSSIDEIERDGEATVSIAGRPFRVRKQFLDDLDGREG